jgi:translation initiation factor RLI1
VLGLVGTNGIGKSTALKILAGKLKPNLGRLEVSNAPAAVAHWPCSTLRASWLLLSQANDITATGGWRTCKQLTCSAEWSSTRALLQSQPDWQEILTYFRGSELQNYFQKILEDDLKAIIKPQYVDNIPKAVR